jgi:hypothetical protein
MNGSCRQASSGTRTSAPPSRRRTRRSHKSESLLRRISLTNEKAPTALTKKTRMALTLASLRRVQPRGWLSRDSKPLQIRPTPPTGSSVDVTGVARAGLADAAGVLSPDDHRGWRHDRDYWTVGSASKSLTSALLFDRVQGQNAPCVAPWLVTTSKFLSHASPDRMSLEVRHCSAALMGPPPKRLRPPPGSPAPTRTDLSGHSARAENKRLSQAAGDAWPLAAGGATAQHNTGHGHDRGQ